MTTTLAFTSPTVSAPQIVRSPAALAILSVAQFLIALDYSIIYVALPSIARDLHLRPGIMQWVISAYAVLFAGFLMVGGRLTDRVGAKRLFIIAITLFGVASAAGGVAHGGGVLLAARGIQGLGAALLQPAILGLIGTTFPSGPSRSRALSVWGSVGASGLAAGVVLGGLLTTVSWRLTFFINVPLTLLTAVGAVTWFARSTGSTRAKRIPLRASILATGALLSLVIGLTLSAEHGARVDTIFAALTLSLVLFVGFIVNESTSSNVLIEPILRGTRSLRIGSAATALYMASVGSEFYLVTLLLQSAKSDTPLQAGVAFLPLAVMVMFGNMAAGRAVRRFTPAAVLIAGFLIAAAGLGLLSFTLHGSSYAGDLLPGLIISGLGHGTIYTCMFIIGTQDTPDEHQGTTGALLTTSQYLSAAVAIAILTLVLGGSPGNESFRAAFLITTAAAALGAGLISLQYRRLVPTRARANASARPGAPARRK